MRRDFLDAGRAFAELEQWALEWKERIGTLYHLNRLRLEQWDRECPLAEQSDAFHRHHEALQAQLQRMHEEATRIVAPESVVAQIDDGAHSEGAPSAPGADLSKSARTKQKKVLASLLEHWSGLTVFVEHPEVPRRTTIGPRTRSARRSMAARTIADRGAFGVRSWPPCSSPSCRPWCFGASTV